MRQITMPMVAALALPFAACVDVSDHQTQITVVQAGAPAKPVPATPAPVVDPLPDPQAEPPLQPAGPQRWNTPVAETEPAADADDGLAPYPAWNGYDLDCSDMDGPVRVDGDDPHNLDGDGDGVGCESR